MKLKVLGDIFGSSGYAIHTRNLLNALSKIKGLELQLECRLINDWVRYVNDNELKMIKNVSNDYDKLLLISLPTSAEYYFCEDKPILQYVVWEGDKIPLHWIDILMNDKIEYILVPSEHTMQAIQNTWNDLLKNDIKNIKLKGFKISNIEVIKNQGIMKKVKIVPHGVDTKLFYPKEIKKDKFTFLMNKGFRNLEDRGGMQYGIQAFLEEFTSKDNVKLLIKINPAYGIPDIQKIINKLKPKDKIDFAPIEVSNDNFRYNELVNIYNQANIFVMPSRAEAFGLPAIEAMACGLPVITTNFGGQTDFVPNDGKVGYQISGKLEEVKHDVMYESISWLTPDIKELKKTMRFVYEYQNLLKNKSKKISESIKQYSWDNSAKIINKLL